MNKVLLIVIFQYLVKVFHHTAPKNNKQSLSPTPPIDSTSDFLPSSQSQKWQEPTLNPKSIVLFEIHFSRNITTSNKLLVLDTTSNIRKVWITMIPYFHQHHHVTTPPPPQNNNKINLINNMQQTITNGTYSIKFTKLKKKSIWKLILFFPSGMCRKDCNTKMVYTTKILGDVDSDCEGKGMRRKRNAVVLIGRNRNEGNKKKMMWKWYY